MAYGRSISTKKVIMLFVFIFEQSLMNISGGSGRGSGGSLEPPLSPPFF